MSWSVVVQGLSKEGALRMQAITNAMNLPGINVIVVEDKK